MNSTQQQSNKPENQIRIGMNSRVGSIVRYVNLLLKDNKYRSFDFSAIGGAISKLVSAVELLKVVNPGLFQVNHISTVSIEVKDSKSQTVARLYPKLEVVLTLDEPSEKTEGFQAQLSENQRNRLFELLNRSAGRGPRGGRGDRGFRGGRGSRGDRGFRGGRGSRGGRGFRGAPRGGRGFRGAPRGGRGFRGGAPRGGRGFRGAPRGGRGFRGAPRGGRGF